MQALQGEPRDVEPLSHGHPDLRQDANAAWVAGHSAQPAHTHTHNADSYPHMGFVVGGGGWGTLREIVVYLK